MLHYAGNSSRACTDMHPVEDQQACNPNTKQKKNKFKTKTEKRTNSINILHRPRNLSANRVLARIASEPRLVEDRARFLRVRHGEGYDGDLGWLTADYWVGGVGEWVGLGRDEWDWGGMGGIGRRGWTRSRRVSKYASGKEEVRGSGAYFL